MLLNIDKPLGTATVHTEGCSHVPNPFGTQFKPAERMGRDGGWFHVETPEEGALVAGSDYRFIRCSYCD